MTRLLPAVWCGAALLLVGCTAGATLSPPASRSASPGPTLRASPPPTPGALSTCPPSRPENALSVFARPGGAPDDLAPAADGGLWISDQPNGRITRLDATGAVVTRMVDPRGPEGIVPQPDGTLIVAEQGPDRVVVLRPPSALPVTVLARLQPVPGRLGLDSIAADRGHNRLLIPDSARGALRAMPLGGGPLSTLATGLGRPVDALAGPDGFVYVAAENAPGLARVPPDGGEPVAVSSLDDLDDLVAAGALLYATDLADGTVRAVDPRSGETRVLVTGIAQPQGLARLADGRLAVSDAIRGLVLTFAACEQNS